MNSDDQILELPHNDNAGGDADRKPTFDHLPGSAGIQSPESCIAPTPSQDSTQSKIENQNSKIQFTHPSLHNSSTPSLQSPPKHVLHFTL
jgi:hypothetical protein